MAPRSSVVGFLHLVADELDEAIATRAAVAPRADSADAPVAKAGAAALRRYVDSGPEVRTFEPSSIPAVATLAALPPHPLTDALRDLAPELPWQPSHRVDDGGANIGLVMLDDCLELGELGMGIMLVGPNDAYPEHHHPPAEVYLVLGGAAEWRFGGSDHYVERRPGDIVFNHPNHRHGIRTSSEPTVAIWVLFPPAAPAPGGGPQPGAS